MGPQLFYHDVNDADRASVTRLTCNFFNALASAPAEGRLHDVVPYTRYLTVLNRNIPAGVSVVMNEIGYLAGMRNPEYGLVSKAFCAVGERAHQAFLTMTNTDASREMQDGCGLMFHLSNLSLPHDPEGGVATQASAELYRATAALYRDSTEAPVKSLCDATLSILELRNQRQAISRFYVASPNKGRQPQIEARAPLYRALCESAGDVVAALACDKMRVC